jgi:hypothetical protein
MRQEFEKTTMAKPVTLKIAHEFGASVLLKLPSDMTEGDMNLWIANKGLLGKYLRQALRTFPKDELKKEHFKDFGMVQLDPVEDFTSTYFFVKGVRPDGLSLFIHERSEIYHFTSDGEWDGKKIEKNLPARTIWGATLIKPSTDTLIMSSLGGPQWAETKVAHVAQLLTRQGRGESGPLLTNSHSNLFFVKCKDGKLWVMACRWCTEFRNSDVYGWEISAYDLNADVWNPGNRVFGYTLNPAA